MYKMLYNFCRSKILLILKLYSSLHSTNDDIHLLNIVMYFGNIMYFYLHNNMRHVQFTFLNHKNKNKIQEMIVKVIYK